MAKLNDNILSKNIRPAVLVYMILFLTIVATIDAASGTFSMPEVYVELFKVLSSTIVLSYFGSRGFEKVASLGDK